MATEVISPWTIYWIMQLDTILGAVIVLAVVSGVSLGCFVLIGTFNASASKVCPEMESSKKEARAAATCFRMTKLISPFFVIFFLAGVLTPNAKTVAAMILIPAIANNETVQNEASEIYQLAKDGLRELVKPEPKK